MAQSRSAVAALFVALEGRFVKFESAMQKAASQFARFSKRMDKIGNTLTKNLSIPLAGVGIAAYKAALQMDEAFDTIRISTGKTGDELKGLQKDFNAVFTSKAASGPKETAIAISELSKRLGLTGEPLRKLSEQLLVVSRLTGTDVNTNVKTSAQLFNQWGIAIEQQSSTLDMLFSATEKAGVPFDKLLETLTQYGPTLQTAGFSIQQSTALLSQFEKSGIDSGAAMSGLSKALRSMAEKGIKDIPGALTLMITDIKNAKTETQALSMANNLFGKSSVSVTKAIRDGTFDIKTFVAELQNSNGSIESAREDSDGLAERMKILGNMFISAAEPLEGALNEGLKALEPLIQAVANALKSLSEGFASLSPKTQAVIIGVVGLAAAAGPIALLLSGMSSGLVALYNSTKLLLGPWGMLIALFALGATMMASPEFARGMEIIKNKFNELTDSFFRGIEIIKNTVASITDNFSRGLGELPGVISGVKDKILAEFDAIYVGIKDALVGKLDAVYGDFKRGLDVIYNSVANLKARLIDHSPLGANGEIATGLKDTFVKGGQVAVDATKKVTDTLFGQWDLFSKKHKTQLGGIAKDQKQLAKALDDAFNDVEKAIYDKAVDPLDEFSQKLFDGIRKKDLPALKKLAKEFITSTDKANDFATALGKASDKNEAFKKEQEELTKVLSKVGDVTNKLTNNANQMVTKFRQLFARKDVAGVKAYAEELHKAGESLQEINQALGEAQQANAQLREEAFAASQTVVNSFGRLAEILGAPTEGVSQLVDSFQSLLEIQKSMASGGELGSIVDAFSQLGDFFSGNIDDSGLKNLSNTMSGLLDTAINIAKPFAEMGSDGGANDLQQGVTGGLALIGGIIGGIYGGPAGAAAGSGAGAAIGSMIPGLVDTDSADHEGRKAVEQYIEGMMAGARQAMFDSNGLVEIWNNDVLRGTESHFDDGTWATDFFGTMGQDAQAVFTGLGTALKELLGVTADVGTQMGFILANTFGGNIDNARMLVQMLSLDFEQLQQALIKTAIRGQITWHEYAVQLQGLQQAFQPGLVAVGDMAGAVDNLISSGGRGMLAIKSLRDLSIEATEAGVKNLSGLRAHLLSTGKYTVQQIDQIFAALNAQGVTNLDELANLSDENAGLIVANLESMGFAFAEVAEAAGDFVSELDAAQGKADGILATFKNWPKEVKTRIILDVIDNQGSEVDKALDEQQAQIDEINKAKEQQATSANTAPPSSNRLMARTAPSSTAKTTNQVANQTKTTVKKTASKPKKVKGPSKEEIQAAQQIAEAVTAELAAATGKAMNFGTGDNFSLSAYQGFFGNVASSFSSMSSESQRLGNSLGNALKDVLRLSDDAAAKFNQMLGVEFAGNIDKGRHYVAMMKYDFDDLTAGLVKLASQGAMTWGEFATQVQTVTDLFKPGISTAGDYAKALDNFWGSGGSGFEAIQSIRDMGIEALEAQITTIDELKNALIATGRPAEQIQKIFDAIASAGITTTSDLAQLTDVLAGTIAGNAANAGFLFAAPAAPTVPSTPAVDPEEQRLRQRLSESSSSNRRARQKALDDYLSKRKATQGFAKGAIIHGGSLLDLGSSIAKVAEFEPEIIAPLSKLGGMLPASAKRGAGSNHTVVNYNINAPNADAGVVTRIEQMLRNVHESAVATSVAKVADMARRGGGYSTALRGN